MIWLEILLDEVPVAPGHFLRRAATHLHRGVRRPAVPGRLSAFTAVWNYMAVVGIVFWVLFYLL